MRKHVGVLALVTFTGSMLFVTATFAQKLRFDRDAFMRAFEQSSQQLHEQKLMEQQIKALKERQERELQLQQEELQLRERQLQLQERQQQAQESKPPYGAGQGRATLTGLTIVNERGEPRISMDTVSGEPILVMRDQRGFIRLIMGINKQGESLLTLLDQGGTARIAVGVSQDRQPMLTLLDESGKERAYMRVTKEGPLLVLKDGNNKERAAMVIIEGEPFLTILDENRKITWVTP